MTRVIDTGSVPGRPSGHVHVLIKQTAQGMAEALYEHMMQDNFWYLLYKDRHPGMSEDALRKLFIRKNWGGLVDQARSTLAGMLSGPQDSDLKEQIYDALILDNTLIRGKPDTAN